VSTSITIRRYLNRQDVRYATTEFSGGQEDMFVNGNEKINPTQIARAVVLKDLRGMLMAVLPGPNSLDLSAINRQLHRNLREADVKDYQTVFADCTPGILPPLGEAYGFETVIDDGLLDQEIIYFVSGNSNELVRISGYDFQLLHSNAWFGNSFSQISKTTSSKDTDSQEDIPETPVSPIQDIRQRIEALQDIPKLPLLAQKINQLNSNPYAHGEDLAKLLDSDIALSDQIIQYAKTAPYVKEKSVSSIRQVISRALSYDLVMNLALAIATMRSFKIASPGPLGLQAFWRHATYSATVTHGLCQELPRKLHIQAGKAVLCAMLQNLGHLVFGTLFPKEFGDLNTTFGNTSDLAIIDLEHRMFGINHAEIGYWLCDAWCLPSEIITVCSNHHDPEYDGIHKDYTRLIYLTNQLLKQHNIGDATDSDISDDFLIGLGLTRQQITTVLEKTILGRNDLDSMARQLAA